MTATFAAPARAAPAPGFYIASLAGDGSMMALVGSAGIEPLVGTQRVAEVYYLDRFGAHDERYVESFDCQNHRRHRISGDDFIVAEDNSDILVGPPNASSADDDDPAGTMVGAVELFVCQWPTSVRDQTPITGVPEDPRMRMLTLGVSIKQALAKSGDP